MSDSKQQKIGAVWIKDRRDKNENFLSLQLELNGKKIDLVAWKNSFKKEKKHPDYLVYPSKRQELPKAKKFAPKSGKRPQVTETEAGSEEDAI